MGRSRPLHLVEVGVHWPPETFLRRKLEGLAARGIRVTVAPNLIVDADATLRGVELLPPPRPGSGASTAWRAGLALLVRSPRRLLRLLRNVGRVPPRMRRRHGGRRGLLAMCLPLARLRPDVVQFEWNPAAVDHLPLFDVWRCPVVTSCRGTDLTVYPHVPSLGHYAARLPEVMRRASAVHCVSESLKREAAGFGLDPGKAWVIRPAVDHDVFRPRAGRGDNGILRVLTVGGLRWEKGYEYALQAIRELVDRGVPVQLDVIGDVPDARIGWASERDRILHTVADLGLEKHVSLPGGATAAEVSRRLAGSEVLLHASVAEGIPNVVLEAMACGVPVVTTDCGGVREAVTDGVEGFVVAPRDPEKLAAALARLWRDPELRRRMGEAGRTRVQGGFTLERQLQDFLEMYREVVA
jgi:colanic acid/amylovoran biosynthesis glycosyltransferase